MRSLFSYKKPCRKVGGAEAPKQKIKQISWSVYTTPQCNQNQQRGKRQTDRIHQHDTSMIVWKVRLQGETRYTYAHHGQAAALNSCSSTAVAATGSANSGSLFRIDLFSMSILFS